MKTSHVIILNILMLVGGLLGFNHYLTIANKPPEPKNPVLLVAEYHSISNKSKLPDTLIQIPKFVKLFDLYAGTNPTESIDAFMAKITPAIAADAVKLQFKDDFEILKTRADQILLNRGFKRSSSNVGEVGFIIVAIIMALAGLLGGLLANFRGFYELIRDEKDNIFPAHLHFPYLVRPLTGFLCGILVFFLVNVLVAPSTATVESNAIPFKTMISLIGLAIIAGFASQEFTEKLKVAASALFGASLKVEVKKPEGPATPPKPGTIAEGGETLAPLDQSKNQPETVQETVTYTLRNRD